MLQGTESDSGGAGSDPHSFVNHYANVNNTFRQSWKKQKPIAQQAPSKPQVPGARGYSSFTESSDQVIQFFKILRKIWRLLFSKFKVT